VVPGVRPVRLLVNEPIPVPLEVLLSAVVGFEDSDQQTPLAVIVPPPSAVMFPPVEAPVIVIIETVVVVSVATPIDSVVNVISSP
jgi:hypothetical protein